MNTSKKTALAAVAALGAVALLGAAGGVLSSKKLSASTALTPPRAALENKSLPGSFSEIIDQVSPAVVSLRVTGKATQSGVRMQEIPEPFKRFFGENFRFPFGDNNGSNRPRQAPRVQGMGSGFFIDADGHVVTNNHVIGNADRIEIVLKGGETYDATLVGRDPKTDLALLKVTSDQKFHFVAFGDSTAARVGDWVIAVGSPFGLGHTATTGIVSARGRDIGAGPYDDFLQIDAPINKGNSGGPTFNIRGEVIGVNTAIISPSGASAGIGFAVPANMVKSVIAQLKENGSVSRGWLGVNIQNVTPDLAAGLGLKKPEGALVASVTGDSPAATAGLKAGDVIVAVDGERIEKMRELPRRVAIIAPGQSAKMTVYREGGEHTLTVTIGTMPSAEKVADVKTETGKVKFGMTLAAVDDNQRVRFGLGRRVKGVVVMSVTPDGVAARKGIRPGDVIRRVSGQEIRTPDQVSKLLSAASKLKSDRKAVLMLVNRKGNDRYIALPLRDA